MTVGNMIIAGVDVFGGYERPSGFNVILQIEDVKECEKLFAKLADGGEVIMPFEKTFWSPGFGVVRDKFDVPWEVNCNV